MAIGRTETLGTFLRLIQADQTGCWAVCKRRELRAGSVKWFRVLEDLSRHVAEGQVYDYFVPTPLKTEAAALRGVSKFELLAETTNVVRVDLDPPKTLAYDERVTFLMERLAVLRAILGEPTAVVDSGRGHWVYYKLAVPVPKDEARDLNRILGIVAGSDDGQSYNPSQWARLPGSVNEKTGETSSLVSLDPTSLLDPVYMRELLMARVPPPKSSTTRKASRTGTGYTFPFTDEELSTCELPELELADTLWEYIDLAPSHDECKRRYGRTRSEVEQSIFNELARSDWPDLWIHAFAFQHQLPRYMREFRRKSIWADLTISRAREWVEQEREALAASHSPSDEYLGEIAPPLGDEGLTRGRRSERRHRAPRWLLLKEVDGSRPGEIYQRAREALEGYQGASKRSLQGHMAWLVENGYVDRVSGQDGIDRLVRTQKGEKAAAKESRPLPLLSYLLTEEGHAKRVAGIERRREERREERRPKRRTEPRTEPSPSAALNRKARHIYRTDLDGRLRIGLNGRERVFYLQLLTPADDIITALFHHQLHVGWDDLGLPRYANAISPLEPALGGTTDPVFDRGRHWPWEATLSIAARLHGRDGSFKLAEAIAASGEIVPAIGYLMEDTKDFWFSLIKSIAAPHDRILRVERHGPWNARSFTFEDLGPGLPLSIPEGLDLDGYIEEIASRERLDSILASIPDHRSLMSATV